MERFKKGDWVICVDDTLGGKREGLREYATYLVESHSDSFVHLTEFIGRANGWNASRFVKASDFPEWALQANRDTSQF